MSTKGIIEMEKQVWIGLAEVRAKSDDILSKGRVLAFTNCLAFVANKKDFATEVSSYLLKEGYEVIGIEEEEPLTQRVANWDVSQSLIHLGEEVKATRQVRVGDFYTYPENEECDC